MKTGMAVMMAVMLALLPASAKAGWFMGIGSTDDCKCCDGKATNCSQPKSKQPAKSKPKTKTEKKAVTTISGDEAKLKSLVDRAEKAEKRVELFSKEVIDQISKSAKDGKVLLAAPVAPKTEAKLEAKAEVKTTPKAEPQKEVKKTTTAKEATNAEQECITMGSTASFMGSGLITFGAATGNPVLVGAGIIIELTGIFDKEVYGSNTDPRCKAAATLMGLGTGYGVGSAVNASDHRSSSGDSGPGEPLPVPGPGTGDGPTTPPPVP